MIIDDFPLELINNWNVKILNKDSIVFDVIVLNIGEKQIDVPLFFARSKNMVYNSNIKDYYIYYSKNISFINDFLYLQNTIPNLYSPYESWHYQYDKHLPQNNYLKKNWVRLFLHILFQAMREK